MDIYGGSIKFLPGVGEKRAQSFEKELGIRTIYDLLQYYPYKYIDRSRFYTIREIDTTAAHIQIKGVITEFNLQGEGRKSRLVAKFSDGRDSMDLVFFNKASYLMQSYKTGVPYVAFGKPKFFSGRYSMVHPDLEPVSENNIKGFMPLYNTSENMKKHSLNTKAVMKAVYSALLKIQPGDVFETLPGYLLEHFHLPGLYDSLRQVHFPSDARSLERVRFRLKFEELFYVQLAILKRAAAAKGRVNNHPFLHIGRLFNDFYHKHLPFELTNAQKRVLKEIRADVRSDKQMNRLLQGDVGSGKTMVALLSMLMAIDNGYQACIVAPTEILAQQHYDSMSRQIDGLGVQIRLLTGSTKKSEREEIAGMLEDGTLGILVGTHAVFEENVKFRDLGLAIIDEQHRFGVAQRAALWEKNIRPPHVLVMSATPIPRTLAMTLYGDLDVSVIDELPPGRKPVMTRHIYDAHRDSLNRFLLQQIQSGRQVYVVYPLISESEKMDLKNLEDGYDYMKKHFPDYEITMVHGKMSPKQKEENMARFVTGYSRILVSTTVIEVGVNVPNATVMVIENAERFGLSQLHQLRGRVGRGAEQSYCLLVSGYKISAETRKRLDIMVATNDGFEIAEADLKLRGPGDLEGTLQSGMPFDLHIANLARDGRILQLAREAAADILAKDPMLEERPNAVLQRELRNRAKSIVNWGAIS